MKLTCALALVQSECQTGTMETAELLELLSPGGLTLLDSLEPWQANADAVKRVDSLRRAGHSPALVAAVLSQNRLRARAVAKFGPFASRMLFTEAGLEQATRLKVAALHAGRFAAAGLTNIADLGSGIGGDALAIAALDLAVTAVELDEVTAAIASYNLAPWPTATVVNADAASFDLADFDAVYLDPARRTAGHSNTSRLTDPADYSPALDFAFVLGERMPTGIKLGPGIDRDLIPPSAEAQWVSVDHDVVELGLWFGSLARPGIRRSALVIGEHGSAELTAEADSADVATGTLGEYVYEPDGAVIRSRLIGDLGRQLGATMLSTGIAYLTSDTATPTPFASCFRITDVLPFDEKSLRRELRNRDIGTLEIKKRGVDIDPAQLRKKLALKGAASATLIVTRVAGRHMALLAERVTG
ncbi:50S ribosomal protein L11 methyltransferase [soil metagenome]